MRDPDRMESLLALLREYWERPDNQDQRLGQLLLNLVREFNETGSVGTAGEELFRLEDSNLFDWLDIALDGKLGTRKPGPPVPPSVFMPTGIWTTPSPKFPRPAPPPVPAPSRAAVEGLVRDHMKSRKGKGRR